MTDPLPARSAQHVSTRRILTMRLLRAVAATAVLLTLYFVLPLDRLADLPVAVSLPMALAAFAALMVFQVKVIMASSHPGLQAVEMLAISLPLFLVIFAASYYVMGVAEQSWFSESLSKLDALYFTVTVFATVGFGDIAAIAPPSRVAVTVQMLADLIILGVGVRVITGAVREARAGRADRCREADAGKNAFDLVAQHDSLDPTARRAPVDRRSCCPRWCEPLPRVLSRSGSTPDVPRRSPAGTW